MPEEDVFRDLSDEYDPPHANHSKPKPLKEVVDEALRHYDNIQDEDRFAMVYYLEKVGDEYAVRLVAPLVSELAPTRIIPIAAQALRESGTPTPDAALVLLDMWGYPREITQLATEVSPEQIQAIYDLLPPSRHPDRVNVSICHIIYKDGHQQIAEQVRGDATDRVWWEERDLKNQTVGRVGEIFEAMKALVS